MGSPVAAPVLESQIRTVSSHEPVAILEPSGEYATHLTSSWCCMGHSLTTSPVCMSHRDSSRLSGQLAMVDPSGDIVAQCTRPAGPRRGSRRGTNSCASHIQTVLFSEIRTTEEPSGENAT